MKAAKKSSIPKAASTKLKSAAKRRSLPEESLSASQPAVAPFPASKRFVRLSTGGEGVRRKTRVEIPPILLEGDSPGTPLPESPLAAPANHPAHAVSAGELSSLPDAYGTRRLRLTARDPNWIHAHWDFTREQLREANGQAADGQLVLRLFNESTQGAVVSETKVHPESVRWMVHAPVANAPYAAEIGFYNKRRRWSPLAVASPVRTPPAAPSNNRKFQLATLAPDGTMERHTTIKQFTRPHRSPISSAALSHRDVSSFGLGELDSAGLPGWVGGAPSSVDVTSWDSAGVLSSLSSPMGGALRRPFRLEVNAELIVYGSTEPGATLQIGEDIIPLQPDGTFRLRFALPDGAHCLPVKAVSAQTGETCSADLRFSRHTGTDGQVGTAPREPGLHPPAVENL